MCGFVVRRVVVDASPFPSQCGTVPARVLYHRRCWVYHWHRSAISFSSWFSASPPLQYEGARETSTGRIVEQLVSQNVTNQCLLSVPYNALPMSASANRDTNVGRKDA
ncbi:hypothetical protein Y032_0006g3156 [Ancylostoma ceylanicum]|uniref:Uncharacterized protein n=1 Tax=Ancylostoma ceylanicum TaxID=53326 RepID=A0A016VSJ7_9BILA|nr:hypothetical protein Y032_0006g3156 [Ancylostoma ceylanicum]